MKQLLSTLVLLHCTTLSLAQDAKPSSSKQSPTGFEWLKQFEGQWATAFNGTMVGRITAKRWIVNEISFHEGAYSVQTIGYDEKKKRFVGTWVDASGSFIWQYSGSVDEAGKVLILEATGPDMSNPSKMRKYRDTYEFKSKDEIYAESQMLDDKGKWQVFNKGKMKRKGDEQDNGTMK